MEPSRPGADLDRRAEDRAQGVGDGDGLGGRLGVGDGYLPVGDADGEPVGDPDGVGVGVPVELDGDGEPVGVADVAGLSDVDSEGAGEGDGVTGADGAGRQGGVIAPVP